ncbi:MAG: PAS domain-containing protein [Deltaproteobacteria bacterium]|nr:PAS domain-containing protein [Deltaproteobacteria bacterium]
MPDNASSMINIAVIGGGTYCKELLEKTTVDYPQREVNARFVAAADPNPKSPGMLVAKRLGLITVDDYHKLYEPAYNIKLFVLLTPEQEILDDILATKPSHIRVQSYHVFEVFWKAISIEERKLRKRNEEVETILNGIEDFIVVLNPDLEIQEVNDTFIKKMGYAKSNVVGRKCYEVFHNIQQPCSNGELACPMNDVIRNKRSIRQIRTRVKQDGEPRYIEVSTHPIWEKSGKISKFVEISRDITQRKKEEEQITSRLEQMVSERTRELNETHDKLLHKDKMASLGKLSASVVHEINNPIAGTLNLILLMKRMIDEGPVTEREIGEFKEFLNLMETENRRISRIISNLLAFSRESKMDLKRVDLNLLLEKTLLLNANLLKINNIKVKKRLSPELPQIIGSEDHLQQVFVNIISNAVEAMEPVNGGLLRVETRASPKRKLITASFKDSGPGISKDRISTIFEPFFTTKRKGKGVGLGLSVAYGIVQDHGGSIRVTSDKSKGTTFKVELPIA